MSKSEKDKNIVITPEDCKAALEFWNHFKIPVEKELEKAFSDFIANPTYDNQLKVKFHLIKGIATSDHEAFSDTMFDEVRKECEQVSYDMAFDDQLEELLSQEDKTK